MLSGKPILSWLISLIALLLCLFLARPATAADISFDEPDRTHINLLGPIEPGDADKLIRLLRAKRTYAIAIHLNSPGGSLAEALLLAKVVEKAALGTAVKDESVCASACFFVWLAGTHRLASSEELMQDPDAQRELRDFGSTIPGFIGLHRPYERDIQSPQNRQISLMRGVSEYLESRLVPRRLVDSMMARPSNDIYWMTDQDLAEIGQYQPALEEYLIRRCEYDRNSTSKELAALKARDRGQVAILRAKEERSSTCVAAETGELRRRGHGDIKRGWKP